MRRGDTDVVDGVCESGVDLADDFLYGALCGVLVCKVERGRVDEGECERKGVWVEGEVDVDGEGANVGCVAAAALHELGDGGELVLAGGGGDVAGVEEEAEEGRLSGALAGDHERVAAGIGVHGTDLASVAVVGGELAAVYGERHGPCESVRGGTERGLPARRGWRGAIKEGPQRSRASDTEPIGTRPELCILHYRGTI